MTDIARLSEALADRYAIERELGAGGMATVYLARDLKHDRQVALKVLKPELAAVLGADRFIVEIKTTASLQHPHILPLFDSGSAGGFLYYAMPYIAGETIREKLNRETQFGVTEAVRIAREVADALDYAHRHGVIHRDIKPENILLHDGRAMVMDFGIALALSAAAGGRMTETGLSLGTPHYMSPEQATAEKELTPRSDVYSLASVLYEMLAGNPPHTGASAQQIIMKIIAEPVPPVTTLRKSVPPNVAAALAKALEKLPADRFESAKEFSDALANAAFTTTTAASGNLGVASARNGVSKQLFGAVAAVAVVATAALAWMALRSRSDAVAAGVPMHFDLATVAARSDFEGGGGYGQTILLSPDGRTMVYRLFGLSSTQLMRRSMLQHDAVPLAGSANVQHHALSPDGKWVAFFVDSQLMKVRIEGGLPQKIATVSSRAISWGPNDVLVLGAQPRAGAKLGIGIVSAAGGPVREITRPDSARGEGAQRWPRVLADGKTVLYASWPVSGEKSRARIGIASLETGETTILDLPGSSPFGMFEGHLIYARPDGPIMAVPLDVGRRRVTGEPVVLVEDAIIGVGGASQASLSENGTLVYRSGVNAFRLVLVDARGGVRSMTPDLKPFRAPRFSPDGSKVAVWSYLGGISSLSQNGDGEGSESWVFDSGTSAWTKLPAAPSELHQGPEWTPDGKRILFPPGSRTDTSALFSVVADGSVAADRVATVNRYVGDVVLSRDGRTLVLGTGRAREKKEIWYRSLVGDTTPRLLLSGGYMPALSPDGKWLAYVADETGLPEVYVRAFPGPVSRWAVSTGGGTEPRWAPDGRHLYYRSPAKVMSAAVATTPSFAVTGREELFADAFVKGEVRRNYDVSPDGKNFLMLQRGDSSQKVMVFVNWFTEIRQKLAAAKR